MLRLRTPPVPAWRFFPSARHLGRMAKLPEVRPSKRVRMTDTPCIVTMQKMLKGKEGILSLAQGIVHWGPPPAVATAVAAAAGEPDTNAYGPDDGTAQLREALLEKLRNENKLEGVDVMVTAGANQAFANVVLSLVDSEDGAVLFKPFYFNHLMALQMTGGADNVILGPVDKDALPDVEWLERCLSHKEAETAPIRMVTIVNPCNPTGVTMPEAMLQRISALCAKYGSWLCVDNTYEHFTYEEDGGCSHTCVGGDHVLNVFSFSKAFGMMGWRVGYVAYPARLKDELMKVQDTIAICPAVASQKAALAALSAGRDWVKERVKGLRDNRATVRGAIEAAIGKDSITGGSGAIYLMVRLPAGCLDDFRVVDWLNEHHKVCVIPGSACGSPGHVRVCYANLDSARCVQAAERLRAGLQELAEKGLPAA